MSDSLNLRGVAKSVKAEKATLDGEIVALDENGMPCFDRLQFRKGRPRSIVFYAFDLLYLDGFNLTQCPLVARKKALKRILPKQNTGRIRFTDRVAGRGEPLFEIEIEKLKLEGMMMKHKDSVYAFTRSRDWLKVKSVARKAEMQKRIETWEGRGNLCGFSFDHF